MKYTSWLRLFLPLALLVILVFTGYAYLDSRADHELRLSRESTTLELAADRLAQQLIDSVHDLRVIANTPAVTRFIEEPSEQSRGLIEPLMAAFVGQKWEYRQLRLLNADGIEIVRVDRTAQGPKTISGEALQDKSDREYFQSAIGLRPDVAEVSPFDLNVEFGAIERPYNPTLRLLLRLKSSKGADYVLVANLRGNVLLSGVNSILASSKGEAWLLDDRGFWLIHPEPAMKWGAQLNPANRLGQKLPQLARALNEDLRHLKIGENEYVTHRINPLEPLVDRGYLDKSPSFDLVIRIPSPRALPALNGFLGTLIIVLLASLALISRVIVEIRARATQAEDERRRLVESNASESRERAWIRDHIYDLSLKFSAARTAPDLGNTTLRELAPIMGLAAACLYIIRDRRATILSSYGLLDDGTVREFGPGEGLIGEVARTGVERRMSPPPEGYLDITAGMGIAPAADLRVLPLTIHGRCVGVLELAFSQVLDSRLEDLLQQTLPLLALNLDGFHRMRLTTA